MKVGDLITGTDRSYRRSIYRIVAIYPHGHVDLEMFCYDCHRGQGEKYERIMDEFRLATDAEIHAGLGRTIKWDLIKFAVKLIRQSDQEQRLLEMQEIRQSESQAIP